MWKNRKQLIVVLVVRVSFLPSFFFFFLASIFFWSMFGGGSLGRKKKNEEEKEWKKKKKWPKDREEKKKKNVSCFSCDFRWSTHRKSAMTSAVDDDDNNNSSGGRSRSGSIYVLFSFLFFFSYTTLFLTSISFDTSRNQWTMLIKEYRIPVPMTVDEYRIAQLYMIVVSDRSFLLRLIDES